MLETKRQLTPHTSRSSTPSIPSVLILRLFQFRLPYVHFISFRSDTNSSLFIQLCTLCDTVSQTGCLAKNSTLMTKCNSFKQAVRAKGRKTSSALWRVRCQEKHIAIDCSLWKRDNHLWHNCRVYMSFLNHAFDAPDLGDCYLLGIINPSEITCLCFIDLCPTFNILKSKSCNRIFWQRSATTKIKTELRHKVWSCVNDTFPGLLIWV